MARNKAVMIAGDDTRVHLSFLVRCVSSFVTAALDIAGAMASQVRRGDSRAEEGNEHFAGQPHAHGVTGAVPSVHRTVRPPSAGPSCKVFRDLGV
eukprot:8777660-Pyramimonas_sp.AAC.1